jgi:hypothetical protein
MNNRPSVYIETTVVSYLAARLSRDAVVRNHQEITLEWWRTRRPRVRPVISEAVLAEAARGDREQAGKRLAIVENLDRLPITTEVQRIARAYVRLRMIPESVDYDALHLAIASIHAVDYLLTWNCRHLAAATVRRQIAEFNTSEGLATPLICTPEELMGV